MAWLAQYALAAVASILPDYCLRKLACALQLSTTISPTLQNARRVRVRVLRAAMARLVTHACRQHQTEHFQNCARVQLASTMMASIASALLVLSFVLLVLIHLFVSPV